ncbi:MAG TPA: M14 family zinc carboxypeptidase [Actinomycetota bacterium]|nr:M14 family zinc carboxypeptidase [Actinomycetota bacterium]
MRRILVASLAAIMLLATTSTPALSTPVAGSEAEYTGLGRIFPDPHACNGGTPATSPYAKGLVCATDFIQFAELEKGLAFLEETFPRFVEVYQLDKDFNCQGKPVDNPDAGCPEFRSAGLPNTLPDDQGTGFSRDRRPLYMVRITDESVPNKDKKHFVFPLSIHGIERAGVEGGTRAAEDLATWGACEAKKAPDYVDCAHEDNAAPHPLLEATPKRSLTAGTVLKRSVTYMIYPNPDGWVRGEKTEGAQWFQRYNGNGVDLNRDWPEQGYTFRPYTPWSEPETRSFGRVLQQIGPTDERGKPKWTGGIDLHGQLADRAFSFTLIGGSERPFDKNQRVLQTVKGAWADAEARLAYSPIIKPNDAPGDDPRMYGVQWGTIWDTIAYTVTGALGNWIDSPIGLNADGIDNEMSLSHVSNCGIGTCFDPDVEQLHVDGNKSLIYSMLNYSLKPENTRFRTQGRVGYVFNRGAVKAKTDRTTIPPRFANLPPQEDIPSFLLNSQNEFIQEFRVKGPDDGVHNGGIIVPITCSNLQGVSNCALSEAHLERRSTGPHRDSADEWETVNSYFNQSPIYVQAGQALHANLPTPGRWRVRIQGAAPTDIFSAEVDFTKEKGWPDPGQIGYRATNMKFWKDLKPFAKPGLRKVRQSEILTSNRWKKLDTIVITNKVYPRIARKLRKWVAKKDGNLVLTDKALKMLAPMGVVPKDSFEVGKAYAGYVNFASAKKEVTYDDPLARKINQPGAAEGQSGDEVHRRQTYEPVPLGIAIQTADGGDANNSPIWTVTGAGWKKAKGKQRTVGTSGGTAKISYGEIKFFGGRIRILGALLPMPTDKFDHPFGLADYGLTYSGYQMLQNALTWSR